MDITRTRQLLDKIPSRTLYEFRNFEIESQGGWHRQVRYVLGQKDQLADQIEILLAQIDLENLTLGKIKDKEEAAIRQRMVTAEINGLKRQLNDLTQRMAQVDAWLDTYDDSEFNDAITGIEQAEGDSWSETVGRAIGVEVLADKQASKASLQQASMLPLADYKKSVLITNQFATFLKKTAEQVENSANPNRPASMPTQAPVVTADAVAEMAKIRDTVAEVDTLEDRDAKEKKKKKKK